MFAVVFCLWAGSVSAQESTGSVLVEYPGIYRAGDSSLQPKTKVKIMKTGSSYDIVPLSGEGVTLSLPIASMRGASPAGDKSVWLYWYDSTDATKSVHIEMDGAIAFADSVTREVLEYNKRPSQEAEAVKARYEEYRDRALKEAR
jgi:hypothetical protein